MINSKKFETMAIRTQTPRSGQQEHSVPIYATSSFVFDSAEEAAARFSGAVDGNIYSRFSNPNGNEFVKKMCLLEGAADGFATASGMAAVFSGIAPFVNGGDHLVVSRSVFGSTHQIVTQILPRWNVDHTYVDIDNPDGWAKAIRPETKMIFVETPSNPALDLVDLARLGALANERGVLLMVDNCFATPYLQRPIEFGAHLVMHSATKFIDGQGRVIGGVVVGRADLIEQVRFFARHTGPALSPFNAWVLSKSLETLSVRMDRHCANAMAVARFLETRQGVSRVIYPFLESHPQFELAKRQMKAGGGLVTFEIEGGVERGARFLNAAKGLSLTANLGDTRTIVTHPASTTHSKLSDEERVAVGIKPGTIRISVGLEHVDDIIDSLERAIEASA